MPRGCGGAEGRGGRGRAAVLCHTTLLAEEGQGALGVPAALACGVWAAKQLRCGLRPGDGASCGRATQAQRWAI